MATPRVLVLRTAGTNCDEETQYAFELAGARAELVHINHLVGEAAPLAGYQIVVVPGGFTYGDDIAAGKVLAVELGHVLGERLATFVTDGGLVLGICNGFQVLIKTGLLPEARFTAPRERFVTLTNNTSHRFEARWVRLKAAANTKCVFAEPDEELELPVAHGEGRLVARAPEAVAGLADKGQVVYRYRGPDGGEPVYPADPGGSIDHVAGICDATGRVFGLMPHPERHIFGYQHPRWTREGLREEGQGLALFKRAVRYFA